MCSTAAIADSRIGREELAEDKAMRIRILCHIHTRQWFQVVGTSRQT